MSRSFSAGCTAWEDQAAEKTERKVVVALKETIRLMEEVDKAIPGWPIE